MIPASRPENLLASTLDGFTLTFSIKQLSGERERGGEGRETKKVKNSKTKKNFFFLFLTERLLGRRLYNAKAFAQLNYFFLFFLMKKKSFLSRMRKENEMTHR
jgi:hypothetical protein